MTKRRGKSHNQLGIFIDLPGSQRGGVWSSEFSPAEAGARMSKFFPAWKPTKKNLTKKVLEKRNRCFGHYLAYCYFFLQVYFFPSSLPYAPSFAFQPDSHTLGHVFCLTSVRGLSQRAFASSSLAPPIRLLCPPGGSRAFSDVLEFISQH